MLKSIDPSRAANRPALPVATRARAHVVTRLSRHRAWVGLATGAVAFAVSVAAGAAIVDETGGAVATLAATKGSTATGTVTFKSVGKDGVQVTVEVNGLEPGSVHGLHVHEKGDCSAPDATSAGPHFSLAGQQHGGLEGEGHHAGDLGNVTANAAGTATASLTVPDSKLTLGPGAMSVVGRAVVVHAGPDDLKSQPAGNSGARIACGVVERQSTKDGTTPMKPASK